MRWRRRSSIDERLERIMAELDDLKAALTKLEGDVAAFITVHPAPAATAADLVDLTTRINALDATVAPPAPAPAPAPTPTPPSF